MSAPPIVGERTEAGRRRWAVLAAGMLAMAAGCTFQYGLAYLLPAFLAEGMTLGEAGLLASAPLAGLLLTLVAWGAAADRWGERWILVAGLAAAGLVLVAAARMHGTAALGWCLLAAGAAGASVHASSGRLILGWFDARERGLAMGMRQTAQPLGIAVAALTLPPLAASGRANALLFLGGFCLAAAVLAAVVIRDPRRPPEPAGTRGGSPYRTSAIWRIHGASALLIVPQFTISTFALVFLVEGRGWHPAAAGQLLAAAQVGGAAARLVAGWWSDRAGTRLRPMRRLAGAIALASAALAAASAADAAVSVAAVIAAVVLSASPNGLAFTAIAERSGDWAGRALGIQNTVQNAVAAATPPAMAVLIAHGGYSPAFAAAAVFPLAAMAVIPVAGRREPSGVS